MNARPSCEICGSVVPDYFGRKRRFCQERCAWRSRRNAKTIRDGGKPGNRNDARNIMIAYRDEMKALIARIKDRIQ